MGDTGVSAASDRGVLASPATGGTTAVAVGEISEVLHDVGHGAATMSCLAEALAASPHAPHDLREGLVALAQEAERVRELVARIGSGARTAAIPVRELVAAAVAARSGPRSGGPLVSLRTEADVVLLTDPLAVWRVVTNLLDNALRAAGPGGRVEVGLQRRRSGVVLEVTDDGPGPQRGPARLRGRGLDIVARLCGRRPGTLRVERLRRRGARVRVTLPGRVLGPAEGGRGQSG